MKDHGVMSLVHDLNDRVDLSRQTEPPDPEKHFWASMIKSGFRIFGYGMLLTNIPLGVLMLVVAEAIGVVEEFV